MTAEDHTPTSLVTGASSGIGEAICRSLVARGQQVIGAARRLDRLEALAGELGDTFHPLELDINDAAAVEDLEERLARFGAVDVLVNNAGHDIGGRRPFDQGSADQWCAIIETNVQGLIRVTRALIDGMLQRGRGDIVNIGSIAGLKPGATVAAYVASKYAVHGLSETLRLDYAGKGIRVTEIMPGLVRTEFAEQRFGDAERAAAFYDSFDACLQAGDIAEAVSWAIDRPRHVEIAQMVVLPVS